MAQVTVPNTCLKSIMILSHSHIMALQSIGLFESSYSNFKDFSITPQSKRMSSSQAFPSPILAQCLKIIESWNDFCLNTNLHTFHSERSYSSVGKSKNNRITWHLPRSLHPKNLTSNIIGLWNPSI